MRGNEEARVVLTPIATPLPLTFVGLLIASLILSGLELGWVPASETHIAGWVLLGVPLPLQLVAAVFGFHGRSATAATGSSTLAAAWLGVALALINAKPGAFVPSHAVAMLAIGVAAALLIPAASDLRAGAPLAAAVLVVASIRFTVTAVTGLTQSDGLRHTTGILGLVVAAVALYAALALELEDNAIEDTLLPTFRVRDSARALTAPLDVQVEQLENEAGVRKNLQPLRIATLPEFAFDPAPRSDRCEKCGAGAESDLRFVIFRGRTRYVGRTLCDHCTEEVLEAMVASDPEIDR